MSEGRLAAHPAPGADAGPAGPVVYVGFWSRAFAALIDLVLLSLAVALLSQLLAPPRHPHGGASSLETLTLEWILPAIILLVFWFASGTTPGKRAISARIVDADTLGPPRPGQFLVRLLGYGVSSLGALLGWVWIGLDKRKQGWHDKMASTVVIRRPR